ncbi:unnamed protein product [Absidia cylindrospora]
MNMNVLTTLSQRISEILSGLLTIWSLPLCFDTGCLLKTWKHTYFSTNQLYMDILQNIYFYGDSHLKRGYMAPVHFATMEKIIPCYSMELEHQENNNLVAEILCDHSFKKGTQGTLSDDQSWCNYRRNIGYTDMTANRNAFCHTGEMMILLKYYSKTSSTNQ